MQETLDLEVEKEILKEAQRIAHQAESIEDLQIAYALADRSGKHTPVFVQS